MIYWELKMASLKNVNVDDDYLLLHIVAQFQKTPINTTPTQFIITHNSYHIGTTITNNNIRLARANLYIGFSVLHENSSTTTTLLNLLTKPIQMNTHTHVKNW
jgi:hypothetical protein